MAVDEPKADQGKTFDQAAKLADALKGAFEDDPEDEFEDEIEEGPEDESNIHLPSPEPNIERAHSRAEKLNNVIDIIEKYESEGDIDGAHAVKDNMDIFDETGAAEYDQEQKEKAERKRNLNRALKGLLAPLLQEIAETEQDGEEKLELGKITFKDIKHEAVMNRLAHDQDLGGYLEQVLTKELQMRDFEVMEEVHERREVIGAFVEFLEDTGERVVSLSPKEYPIAYRELEAQTGIPDLVIRATEMEMPDGAKSRNYHFRIKQESE